MANNFVMVITSDPQYSWFPENDPPKVGLIACEDIANSRKEDNKRENKLELCYFSSIVERYTELTEDKPLHGGFVAINGDLVCYNNVVTGPNDCSLFKRTFYKHYCQLVGKNNVFFGLGNHDYINNNNDTGGNLGAIGMLDFLRTTMSKMQKDGLICNFDCKKELGVSQYSGSLAYYKIIGDSAFIQLNYGIGNPKIVNESMAPKCYKLQSAHNWLTQTLEVLNGNSKISSIFINLHNFKDDKGKKVSNCDTYTTLEKLLGGVGGKKVKAVFGGHYHTAYGKVSGYSLSNEGREIPIYLSGSASQGSFITLVGKDNGKFDVTVWRNPDVENSIGAKKILEDTLPL